MIKKVLICYTYYEGKEGPLPSNEATENLKFFLDNGIINDSKYLYCINVNGSYKFDFNSYLKKNKRVRLFEGNGKCQLEGYLNIFKHIDINDFYYFFFMYDKIKGPYNKDKLKYNWIEYFTNYLEKYNLIISSYGTSPMGKLFRIPYITMKFMVMNKKTFNLLLKKKYFTDNFYDDKSKDYHNNPFNHVEIKLSYLLLDNGINYVVLDTSGIYDLNLVKFYKERDWNKLFEIIKNLHKNNDKAIINKIFWSGESMKKIFELRDKKYIKKLSKDRNVDNLEKW